MIRTILAFPFILSALLLGKLGEFIGGREIDFDLSELLKNIKN